MSVERNTMNSSHQKFHEVAKAKEFETYRNLPKFTHVPMAVIHPSPKKVKQLSPEPVPDLNISGN
jgi:hypothetical protein